MAKTQEKIPHQENKFISVIKSTAKVAGIMAIVVLGIVIGASLPFFMPVAIPMTNKASIALGTVATWLKAGRIGASFVFTKKNWAPTLVPTVFIEKNVIGALFTGFLGGTASISTLGSIYSIYKVGLAGLKAVINHFFSRNERKTIETYQESPNKPYQEPSTSTRNKRAAEDDKNRLSSLYRFV